MAEFLNLFGGEKPTSVGQRPAVEPLPGLPAAGPEVPATAVDSPARDPLDALVPENRVTTTEPVLLQLMEDVTGSARAWEVLAGNVLLPGTFDLAHLRDIHAHLMQDVYAEPGATRGDERMIGEYNARHDPQQPRVVEYDSRVGSNGENITLLDAGKVNGRLNELSAQLQTENELRGLEKTAFVNRLADYYLQYSQAAPFTAGNEHVLGVVANKIGFRAGYHVDIINSRHVREATDTALALGIGGDKSQLVRVLGSVTREAEGVGPQAARSPTLSAMPLAANPELTRQQTEENIAQGGSKLAERVGGRAGEQFKASMRAIIAGDAGPDHLNVVRTTARNYAGKDLAGETARIEQDANFLDGYRRSQQQQERLNEQQRPATREPGRVVPSEISR